ncbi:MAG TPA: hypothetical protein VM489_09860 [Burkholderiales bacterium]|nr:hypothetical protein [Burkholderiales bacterium]
MPLWKKLWLLFTAIWGLVAALNIFTILAFGEDVEPGRALRPLLLGIAVPALAYLAGWLWARWTGRGPRNGPDRAA